MEKRLLLAVVLMTAAILFTNLVFPPPEPPVETAAGDGDIVDIVAPPPVVDVPAADAPTLPLAASETPGDTIVVASDLYRYTFATRGAALIRAELLDYPSYTAPGQPVQLIPEEVSDFLSHRLVAGQDTFDLRNLPYEASESALRLDEDGQAQALRFAYEDEGGLAITIEYTFEPDGYLIAVAGQVDGLAGRPAHLLTEIGPGFELHEHPDHHSERELAVVTRVPGSVDRELFRRIDQREVVQVPLTWAGIKDKYFLAAVIAGEQAPLQGAIVTPEAEDRRVVDDAEVVLPRARLTAIVPVSSDGRFLFQSYLGPQDYGRLRDIGYDLEEVTPYGYRWLQPVIRPLAAAVLWVMNGLHDTLGITYGWVLVIFGVMMRVVLWPLYAKGMRSQMKNMALQPILQEIREKYKDDPQKQQEAMLGFYKEHGFNPFSGCLPMLVPFPVLITLFFVFQNTIAFRGTEFLWLPDLSLPDPLYILPLILVVSMFGLQWVSARLSGMEQNPQMKMMLYVMPIMMGVIFFRFPAGLNLYYAVNQIASFPQQVLIAKERRRAQDELKKSGGPKLSAPPGGGKRKSKSKR